MTVAELIENLKEYPSDTVVLVTDHSCHTCPMKPVENLEYDKKKKVVMLDIA